MPQDQTNNSEVARWYVVHTYSGYENKVKDTLEKAVENRSMQDVIQEIVVPMEEQIEIKDAATSPMPFTCFSLAGVASKTPAKEPNLFIKL